MAPISVALVTGPMRDTMPSAVTGSSADWPRPVLWGCTLIRLPSWPSSFSRPVLEDCEMPSTPTMAAMPMLIPSADSEARTRRLRKPRLPTRSRSRRDNRDPPALVSRTRRRITDNSPVSDFDAPFHRGGHLGVVGDDHDRGAFAVKLAEKFQNRRAGCRVKVAGRLVGHYQGRATGEGASDGRALLFAARQLVRPVPDAVPEPHPVYGRHRHSTAIGHPATPVQQAVGDGVEHAQAVEQKELLEDETDAPGPQ